MAALDFPTSPTPGQLYPVTPAAGVPQYTWDGEKWVTGVQVAPAVASAHGQCRFDVVDTSNVKLSPFNGDSIKIAGKVYQIPAAGITANKSNCYINGVPGQSLPAGLHYAYLFNNAGTLTLDFTSAARATDLVTPGNIGVEIKGGDPSRTLVGMVRLNVSNNFHDDLSVRRCLSWFNRKLKRFGGSVGNSGGNSAGAIIGQPCAVNVWGGDTISASYMATCGNDVAGQYGGLFIRDNTNPASAVAYSFSAQNNSTTVTCTATWEYPADASIDILLMYSSSSAGNTFSVNNSNVSGFVLG